MCHEEWLATRKKYIGGSDAGAIAGVNPWSSPANVWLDKQSDEVKDIDNERMRIGRDLEDYVAQRFEEATEKKVRRKNAMMVSKEFPFMLANIDREIVGENAILECKTTGSYSKEDWQDGNVPAHYYTQVQHYMAVMGCTHGYIAVLIGNEEFKWYEIKRDDEYIGALINIEKDFYEQNMVLGGFPTPDGSNAYSKAIKSRFWKANGQEVDLTDTAETINQYVRIKDEIKNLEQTKRFLEQQIQLELGENESGYTEKHKVSWKQTQRTNFDKKKFEEDYPDLADEYSYTADYRRFSVK